MTDRSYRDDLHVSDPYSPPPPEGPQAVRIGRRLPSHPAETERRKAWGAKWGPLVKEATKGIREGD